MTNYLGVDWGEKRIGLAIANNENKIATPFKVVDNVSSIFEIIENEKINHLIIGSPKKMTTGRVDNDKFKKFLKIIDNRIIDKNIKISLVDERLSSVQADSLNNKKIKQDRDSLAAMIILQSYLDKIYG